MKEIPQELAERIRKVKLVLVDNDGVMTDGRIVYGDYGDELKFFDVQDGFGLSLLHRAGLKTVMISGRKCRINRRRAKETYFDRMLENVHDKLQAFEKVLKQFKVAPDEVCYIGDDLIDLPPMRRCGFSVAVANAVPEVRKEAHYVTERPGGRGAVREAAELLLQTQGRWAALLAHYLR